MEGKKIENWYDEVLPIVITGINCLLLIAALFDKENDIGVMGKVLAAILIVADYILIRICCSRKDKEYQAFLGAKFLGQFGLVAVLDFSVVAAIWINIVGMTITNVVYIIYMVTHRDKE